MNVRLVLSLIGSVSMVEGVLMIIPLAVSLIYHGEDWKAFVFAIALCLIVGFALKSIRPRHERLRAREGFAVVALSWILVSALGALPFLFSGAIPNYIDCFFETVSGFTTTGATILSDVEALPRGLLFWRSLTHWAGGMGVLVLSLALFPKMGARSIHIMRAESPGPSTDKLVPRVKNTAKILYQIYVAMSVLMVICLLLCGLDLFDSLVHTFGAAGTGGFSSYNLSVAHFANPAAEIVIGVFMALFGINFSLYFFLLHRNFRAVAKSGELRLYLGLLLGSSLLIALNAQGLFSNFGEALRHSFFQVSSIMTTTGYSSHNFDLWPQFARILLVVLMLIGSCAGSTGGGVKVVRLEILLKSLWRDIRQSVHPQQVDVVKLDGRPIEEKTVSSVQGFFFAYIAVLVGATLIVALDNFSFETSLTAVVATLSNIGPGLDLVGAVGNYGMFSPLSKIVLSFVMLIGRLEVFPILMLFVPSAWKK